VIVDSVTSLHRMHTVVSVSRHVGGLLEFADSQCFVTEDSDMAVTGYVISCPDVGQYYTWFNETWLPSLRDKYPKLSASDSDCKVCFAQVTCSLVVLSCSFRLFCATPP